MITAARILRTLIPALLFGPAVALALPPLEQLETRVELSPAAQLAERTYESARDAFSAGRIGLGVSAFGSVGYSHNHDIIDPTHSWSYNQGLAGGGLSVPVLGSRLQLEDSLAEQRLLLLQLDARRQLQRRELITRLRKAYGDYWQAQRLEALAQGYLQDEPAFEHVAALRTRAGLLLEGDRLELLTGFSLARRDEASDSADRDVALGLMREITGQDLEGGVAVRPLVPLACVRGVDSSEGWTDSDPELVGLQKVIALRQSSPRDNVFYPVQSSVQLGYTSRDDMPTGQRGGSAVLSWSFQVPIEYLSQRRLLARAASAQLSRARLEYEVRRQELRQQRRELIARAAVLRRNSEFASARLASADAAVQERDLRAVKLEGDVAEQLQRARLQRYNAAKSLVESDKALVYWYADWARFEATPCQSTVSTAPTQPGAARPGGRTLYLWHSAEWLADGATELGERKLAAIHAAGIERLLISLDAAQMRRVSADPSPLVRAVRNTHEHGFKVELLLGDPDWIRPERRGELLRIIEALRSVPFDGLHLDLEPAQIDPAPDRLPALLGSLAETLAAASAASPWPVALSVHPRDLDVPVGDSSFAEVLHRLRVSPTLMVYVANPDRAVEIAEPLLGHHPELSFSVALSLEKSLGREESLWSYTEAERRRRIERIESQLAAANFSGLTLQLEDAWRDASGLARLAAGE
ncbi:MAG: TolC family protein [Gammaproteobacteria bacterium]|nr:MAG: TolC family protein [Gammaproteobacteria bacterium]